MRSPRSFLACAALAALLLGASPARAEESPPPPDLTPGLPPGGLHIVVPRAEESPDTRLQRLLQEDLAREKVRSGLVDPYFLDLGRTLLATWEPEKAVTQSGISGWVNGLGKGAADFATTYAEQAGAYGKSGSPFAPGQTPTGLAKLAAVPDGLSTDISNQMAVSREIAEQSRVRHAALVRVVQRADGRLVSVELLKPSDDVSVDAEAMRDLRAAAEKLPPPTPGALAGRKLLASIWEFSLTISITPPLPMVAVQFDEVLGTVDARVPLDRRLYKAVRLVSVE